MRKKLIAVAVVCMGLGCDASRSATTAPADSHALSYLALGDSYTIGQSVDPSDRWPVQLVKRLRDRGVDVGEPTIIARTGWTTDELSAAMDDAHPQGPFGLVTLLIGVNDQFRGGTAEMYRPKFVTMLKRAVSLAGDDAKHVVVLSIPDWGVMPFADGYDRAKIGQQIDAFNEVDRDECAKLGVKFVDVTPTSRQATTQPALGAPDGLHPSGPQYAAWARLADNALRTAGQ